MKEVARSLVAAAELYSVEMTEQQLNGYITALGSRNAYDVTTAISIAIKECKFFPKISEILERIPTKPVNTFIDHPTLSDAERALNKDLAPLLSAYLRGETTQQEWLDQMMYFADKHGLGGRIKKSTKECGYHGTD